MQSMCYVTVCPEYLKFDLISGNLDLSFKNYFGGEYAEKRS